MERPGPGSCLQSGQSPLNHKDQSMSLFMVSFSPPMRLNLFVFALVHLLFFFALRKPAICLFTCHPIVESACLSISRSVCKSVMSVCLPIYPSILLNFAPPCVLPFSIRHSTQPHAPVHLFICLSSPLMTPLH